MNNVKMLTIDLLKGQGVPIRSRPESIAITAMMVQVPLIIAIVLIGYYMHNNVVKSILEERVVNYEKRISRLSNVAAIQVAYEKEKEVVNGCLSEAATSVGKRTQWTPILIEVVKSMPDSILLTGINIREDNVKRKIPAQAGGSETVAIVPIKILQINARESSELGYGRSIRDFQDRLRSSDLLGPRLDNINVSQEVDTFRGRDVVAYQINCAFKPEL
jgi:hypothetical protein